MAQPVKSLPAVWEAQVQSPGQEDPRDGNGNPLQYFCLENSMDGGAWWACSAWSHKESDTTKWLTLDQHGLLTHRSECLTLDQHGLLTDMFFSRCCIPTWLAEVEPPVQMAVVACGFLTGWSWWWGTSKTTGISCQILTFNSVLQTAFWFKPSTYRIISMVGFMFEVYCFLYVSCLFTILY